MYKEAEMKIYYGSEYTLSAHAFETTRKAGWIAESLQTNPIRGVEFVAPRPVTVEQLLEVHSEEYVEAVRTGAPRRLAESQGFQWDPGLWNMVCATNGGAVAAALQAFKRGTVAGSLSSGLHHAQRDRGAGFCTFNGLVLAAKAVLKEGARKVLILDLDAHGGGGTYSLIKDDPRMAQIDLVTSPFDTYEPEDPRFYLEVNPEGDRVDTVAGALLRGFRQLEEIGFEPDLVIYNAGMDPYQAYTREAWLREVLVFNDLSRRNVPIAFVLAGGYLGSKLDQDGLVKLHRHTIEVAASTAPVILKRRQEERKALEDDMGFCMSF